MCKSLWFIQSGSIYENIGIFKMSIILKEFINVGVEMISKWHTCIPNSIISLHLSLNISIMDFMVGNFKLTLSQLIRWTQNFEERIWEKRKREEEWRWDDYFKSEKCVYHDWFDTLRIF